MAVISFESTKPHTKNPQNADTAHMYAGTLPPASKVCPFLLPRRTKRPPHKDVDTLDILGVKNTKNKARKTTSN